MQPQGLLLGSLRARWQSHRRRLLGVLRFLGICVHLELQFGHLQHLAALRRIACSSVYILNVLLLLLVLRHELLVHVISVWIHEKPVCIAGQ